MNTADFDFDLPEELIAQVPLEKRDSSKLLILGRVFFRQAFPFVEMLIFACNATNTAFNAVTQHYKSVVIKEFWNYVFIVGEIIVIGVF